MESKTGPAESTLDEKGRVSIPIRFRDQYQGELIINRGMDPCIWIMTPAVWEKIKQDIRKSGEYSAEEWMALEDSFFCQAQEVELDKIGRVAIPSVIRKYANLTKECIVISTGDRLSIWDADTYGAYLKEKDAVVRAALNKIGRQNIFRTEEDGK